MSSLYHRQEKQDAPQPSGLDEDLARAIAAGDPQQDDTCPPDAADAGLIEALTKKAHDFDAVRKSVEDAAAISGTLWFSYLFTLFYIAIAAGAVTHKDLLLENAVKLPFLNVELPLVAFFFLAPVLFIIVHAYVLMHFILLAAKIGTYNVELEKAVPGSADRAIDTARAETRLGHRRQLPSNIFVQFLAGPKDIRQGGLGRLLQAIAWMSLVIGPVVLLLLLQFQFLPYHLEWVTWVQRVAVLADIAVLWFLWPPVLASRGSVQWPRFGFLRTFMLLAVSLVPLGMAFVEARFPGEWLYRQYGNKEWIPANPLTAWFGATDYWDGKPIDTSFDDLLFGGWVDLITRRPKSLFSNRLVLPDFDALEAAKIDDQKKLDSVKHTLDLHARHLEGAVFVGADLRKADLRGAHLEGVFLQNAQLQSAQLNEANLQGARLDNAQLQGTSLDRAHLEGAFLLGAHLQGDVLNGAQLQGAFLPHAQLQGASLNGAQLQGAALMDAQLQGASLVMANLQGASLVMANLQGASLEDADLKGSSLEKVNLHGALLTGTRIWRADARNADWGGLLFTSACNKENVSLPPAICNLKKDDYERLKYEIEEAVPSRSFKDYALKRVARLDPGQSLDGEFGMPAFWAAREKSPPQAVEFEESVKQIWREIGCDASQAPYVVRGFLHQMNSDFPGSENRRGYLRSLATDFLGPEKCPGARGLSEAEIAQLKQIRDAEQKSQ